MTLKSNLYDHPQYYDLVFGSDWKAEFEFLEGCFARYGSDPIRQVFEPACGTGRLLYRLAKAGYGVRGLDLNEHAVAYCNKRLERHGFVPTARVGDMADFTLTPPADAAFNMINSFRHLQTHEQAVGHLTCVRQALREGGLYVLGIHLCPTRGKPMEEESWSARRGNLCVNTHLWTKSRSLKARRETFGMTYDVYTPTSNFQLEDEITFRTYVAREFDELLEAVGGYRVVAVHDFEYNIDRQIKITAATEDVVYVLEKTAG